MAKKKNIQEVKRGTRKNRIPSKQQLYNRIAAKGIELIDGLLDDALNSRNPNVRMGARKVLINKILPDLKAQELRDGDGNTIQGLIVVRTDGNKVKQLANPSLGQQS